MQVRINLLDREDKKILNRIQGDFPFSSSPYDIIGAEIGIEGSEVLERTKKLKSSGIIRKVGPFFDAKKIGHKSTLCAVHVPESRIEEVSEIINSYVEVTHNYLREGSPNIWFTLIAENESKIESILHEIEEKADVGPIRNLPARRMFKIKVDLKLK